MLNQENVSFKPTIHKNFMDRYKEEYQISKYSKQDTLIFLIQTLSKKTGGGKLKNLNSNQAFYLAQRALSRTPMHLKDAAEICPPMNSQRFIDNTIKLLNLAHHATKKNYAPQKADDVVSAIQNEYVLKMYLARFKDKEFYKTREWRELRLVILIAQRVCRLCGRSPDSGAILHVDHIKPRSLYPELSFDPSNLQILCRECNITKSNLLHGAY